MGRLALIAAGGTGGHMFPAQALAEVLLADGWRVTLSTDDRGAKYADNFPEEVIREIVPSATTARGGIAAKLSVPFKILAGVFTAFRGFRIERPDLVIGFGGYPTIPALSAALIMRIPRMIHEQNGIMGRVNRVFSPYVDCVACGTWPTELPRGVKGIHTGNPVRQVIIDYAGSPYSAPGETGPIRILVIGGSQGARVLSHCVPAAIASLPDEVRLRLDLSHQARPEDHDHVASAYRDAGITADIQPFFNDVPQRLRDCHLVISRAGASSVADITVVGRPAILIPYPAATSDHQTANARPLADAGAALILPESVLDPETLARDMLMILSDPARISNMASAGRELGRPDAARRLYDLTMEIAA